MTYLCLNFLSLELIELYYWYIYLREKSFDLQSNWLSIVSGLPQHIHPFTLLMLFIGIIHLRLKMSLQTKHMYPELLPHRGLGRGRWAAKKKKNCFCRVWLDYPPTQIKSMVQWMSSIIKQLIFFPYGLRINKGVSKETSSVTLVDVA